MFSSLREIHHPLYPFSLLFPTVMSTQVKNEFCLSDSSTSLPFSVPLLCFCSQILWNPITLSHCCSYRSSWPSILLLICYIKGTAVRNIDTGGNRLCGSDLDTQTYNSSTWEVMAPGSTSCILSTLVGRMECRIKLKRNALGTSLK
jgi:hypothetical protein